MCYSLVPAPCLGLALPWCSRQCLDKHTLLCFCWTGILPALGHPSQSKEKFAGTCSVVAGSWEHEGCKKDEKKWAVFHSFGISGALSLRFLTARSYSVLWDSSLFRAFEKQRCTSVLAPGPRKEGSGEVVFTCRGLLWPQALPSCWRRPQYWFIPIGLILSQQKPRWQCNLKQLYEKWFSYEYPQWWHSADVNPFWSALVEGEPLCWQSCEGMSLQASNRL